MTNEQILQKAIEKAVKNGMSTRGFKLEEMIESWTEFIFFPNFAKAFWGEGKVYSSDFTDKLTMVEPTRWKYELSNMVLEEEPLKYLEKYLD